MTACIALTTTLLPHSDKSNQTVPRRKSLPPTCADWEALRRAGIVERIAEGVWNIPADLPERGRQYDARRSGGVAGELKSHLPIERQTRIIGATWLDQQLIGDGKELAQAAKNRWEYHLAQDGQRITGIYRRNAMLDNDTRR